MWKLSTEIGTLRECTNEQKAIEILAQAGFDAIDYSFSPWLEKGEMPWNGKEYPAYSVEINKIAKDNGIYFNQAHAPFFFDMSYFPDWNKEILPLQVRCMEACALLDIPHMCVHPIHHLNYRFNKDEIWKINEEYYHLLLPYAKDFGVKIALENMFGFDSRRHCMIPDMFSNPSEYCEFYDKLDDSESFMCLVDTGHCGIVGEDAGDTIRTLGRRVTALHLNDNMFCNDGHLIPLQGLIDWNDVMKALAQVNYQGDFTLEALHVYRGMDEDFFLTQAKYLHDIGRYLISKFQKSRTEFFP